MSHALGSKARVYTPFEQQAAQQRKAESYGAQPVGAGRRIGNGKSLPKPKRRQPRSADKVAAAVGICRSTLRKIKKRVVTHFEI